MHTQVEQYTGDNALYCMNGAHTYTNGTCTWCGRKDRGTQQVEYKPAQD